MKNNMNEMKTLTNMNAINKLKSSLENLVDEDMAQPIVTFPDDTTPIHSEIQSPTSQMETVKFEQTTTNNFHATKVRM